MKKSDPKIQVSAKPSFDSIQSDPENQKFIWSYEVTILNKSDEIVQLLHRFWKITDMTGRVEDVHGAGVIGLQPLIKPDKHFVYTSYCQLTTPQGTMEGHYEMQNIDEAHFTIAIPKFILSAPSTITKSYRSKLH